MKSIQVNDTTILCHEDGSISVPNKCTGTLVRSFGSLGGGYRRRGIRGTCHLVHRLIAQAYLQNFSKNLQVDHINGNKEDNRPPNLRMTTVGQNLKGFRKSTKGASSKYRGVSWYAPYDSWRVQINIYGKAKFVGHYPNEIAAARAYNKAALAADYPKESLNFTVSD